MAEYTYYPDGTIKSLRNGSLYTEYAYDADRNLTGLKTMLGTEVLVDNRYAYDHNGNRTEKQQLNGTTRYTYDILSQLTKVEYPSYTEELYYDRAGNRSRRVSGGMEELYQYDPRNRLTEYTKGGMKTTFTYDNAGNLLADDKARYTYDAFQRTEKVETFDGHIQINRYDAEGLRHEMEEDGKLVQFIFRGQEVAVEETENKVIRFIRGYDLIASDAESARTYYHYASDEMGSITHVITDEKVLNHYEYDAWGNPVLCEETVENRFKFNGQQYDPISQQYYLRARFYNPVIARFTQEDTYRGAGLNLYAYCTNNPVYYVDPSGHQPNCVKDAAQKYIEQGMTPEEAYRRAYSEHAEMKLANGENLTPQERYRLEERQRRLSGEEGADTSANRQNVTEADEANRRVEQNQQMDNSANRPNGPEADVPNSLDRGSSEGESGTNQTLLSGEEWYRYFQETYGADNVNWNVNSFEEMVNHPTSLRGYSADEIGQILGDGWTRGIYGSNGSGWKFIENAHSDNVVFYHGGGGEHEGAYWGIKSGSTGAVKVVDTNTYMPTSNDKATIIYSEDW